jgi:hypothetical protein
VNFGLLSERTLCGWPRSSISRSSTRVTRPLPKLVSTLKRKALACIRIEHAEDTHHAPSCQAIDDEVHRPLLVGSCQQR